MLAADYQLVLKRVLDFVAAGLGLLFLFPLFVVIAISIWLDSRGSFFFTVRAAGRGGRPFDQWKFRSMEVNARAKGHPFETSSTDPRITRVGHFLRRWSLDELPQLWNVLRGEMSLIGPRPGFVEVAELYSPLQARRLRMRPGLTGLAQVHGRNLLPWSQRLIYDIAYIEHYSLWKDLCILFRTFPVVVRGEGIYGPDGRVKLHDLARSLETCDAASDE
jgi:lipopolysaccharide/colanic/teichoic acid biosynthesis glycosyltransferase